jgi:lambda repressor-like predicted transcriptional regulator
MTLYRSDGGYHQEAGMTDYLTEAQADSLLFDRVQQAGSQAAFAKFIGCSQSYLSMVLNGQKPLGGRIAQALGLQPVRLWQRQEHEHAEEMK